MSSPKTKYRAIAAPAPQLEPVAVDIKQAAAFLGSSVRQIRTLVYSGQLKAFVLGKKQLLRVADLRAFIDEKAAA